jgi:TATA-box binding protein (TBP) (component of TFIID and TFIIIB)
VTYKLTPRTLKQGKVVITGGKKESDIERGWRELWPIIKEFVE